MEPPASGWPPLGGNPTSRDVTHARRRHAGPGCVGIQRHQHRANLRQRNRATAPSGVRAETGAIPTGGVFADAGLPARCADLEVGVPVPARHHADLQTGTTPQSGAAGWNPQRQDGPPLGGNPTSRDVAHARRRHAGPGCVGVKRHPALGHLAIGEPGHRAEWSTGGDGNHPDGWGLRRRGPTARPRRVSPDIINRLA